jgi:hypothetical protein
MVLVHITGSMVKAMMDNGGMVKCTEWDNFVGQKLVITEVNMKMI